MDISPLATLNNYRNGEHSICQKPWKKNTKLKPGNVDRAGKREVILKENKDRIAIIDAIQGASTNELKALAEVKDAILSGASTITQQDERQGRVSNRLSRRRKDYEQSTSDSVRDVKTNPYKKRLPAKKERAPINQTVDRSIVATNTQESVRSVQSRQTIRKSDGFIPVAANSAPLEPQSPQSLKGPLRDSNGRFVSQKSNEDVARKKELQNARKADAKLQAGFLRKLGSIMGVDGNQSSSEESLTNAAGVGAGGPLWMAARGMYDITKEITGKAESLKELVEKGKKETSTSKAISPVITYPAAVNSQKATSAKAFNNAVETKSAQAVEEQTKILQTNDNKIIDGLENVSDEIVKLRKSVSSGNKFGLSDLWKNRASRRNKINIGDQTGKNKRNKSKRKGRNLGKKALSAGEKVAAGSAAAGTGVGAAKVVKNKISKPKDVSTISDTSKGIAKETKNTAKAVKSAGVVAEDATIKTGEVIAKKKTESVALKSAAKIGVKSAASTAARAVPIIGSLAMAGYDAIDGYTDTEAQKAAFCLSDDDAVSEQQKTAYATANVLDMGGLVSGATNLIGKGISALGFERAGEKLQNFDTGDIARGVNGAVDITKSVFGSLKDTFLSTDENTKQVKKAVEDGTKKTVDAIHSLGEQLQGGRNGEDGVGEHGYTSPTEFSAPANNTIAADLNIGGSNAKNRNYRNNNLGNLVFANQEGATLESPNAKGEQRFARFNTPEEGIRALANQVSSYYNGTSAAAGYQKLQTVSSIISKWAPPNENNTNQYIDNVSKYLGVSPNEKIDVSNPEVMTQLVRAIATKEGGNPAVNNEFIKNALGAFNTNTGRWEGQFSDETLARINKIQKENGGQLIARDSQYSVGRKVKYANGKSPAQPVLNAVPTATQQPIEVAQHAQAVKKPQKTGNQSQPINPEIVDVNTGSPSSLLERLIAINDSGVGNLFGGAATSLAGTSLGLIKDFASATSFGSISSLSEKAKGMDQALTEKISGLTGKSFGFKKASQVADIATAIQQKRTVNHDTEIIDLLPGDQVSPSTPKTPQQEQALAINQAMAGAAPVVTSGKRTITAPSDVQIYDNGYKVVTGEDKSFFGSLFDSTVSGLKQTGTAVIPAVGDNLSRLVGGIDSTGILNDLVMQSTGQNSAIARAISPLTRNVGDWLNGGIQQTANSIRGIATGANNAIFGSASAVQEPFLAMPPQLPTVTDLARSGIRQPLTTDTINNDPAMLKALDNICSILNDLLNVNKNNTKGDPDKVVKTSQPQPRPRASTTINDPSLDALLED
ncbi:TPA: transglycosylase [Escherichia coli]|uniref:transglycosylase n=1 Tax=Escherichia coli TaxID=562 RepID=UPI001ABC77A9|nr:transglycosylase [Escherichia coli]HBC8440714.1 transglycosylase [Escherichia coli]HBC8445858.1 transglycosylase [Escherichia coli]HBC8452302.1 transglycosylase [Escherichia coli]HBC8461779.1 transglycosylase [Escherichia coli]HBC8467194.1 transglycosylase [Escherichia coli]